MSPLSLLASASLVLGGAGAPASAPSGPWGGAPTRLADTGLYADFARGVIASDVLGFTPQYPLWTDGAEKQRWIRLPAGTAIDARDPEHWVFPLGTRLWKEFAFGRRVETRMLELRADGWNYASYVWSADGTDAVLAPERGLPGACEVAPGVAFDTPGRYDCRACHEGGANRVLGFSALQLSPDRDPLAPHAQAPRPGDVDLAALAARGLLRDLPPALLEHPPRIAAASPRARAALGYLHVNCGSCHAGGGALSELGMALDHPAELPGADAPARRTTLGVRGRFRLPGDRECDRIAPGAPEASLLIARMASRDPLLQMPPLGTHLADAEALETLAAWIREEGTRERAPADAGGPVQPAAARARARTAPVASIDPH